MALDFTFVISTDVPAPQIIDTIVRPSPLAVPFRGDAEALVFAVDQFGVEHPATAFTVTAPPALWVVTMPGGNVLRVAASGPSSATGTQTASLTVTATAI